MKLQVPFIQLPLRFDADRLAAEIAAIGEDAWKPHPQGFPGNSMKAQAGSRPNCTWRRSLMTITSSRC